MKKLIFILLLFSLKLSAQQVQYYDANGRAHNTVSGASGQSLVSLGGGLAGWATISGGGGGTVTSFSKTDGYGILSSVTNPTTTPLYTARVDTTFLQTIANLYPLTDVRYNTKASVTASLALKVNYTDTASMLSPIVHKALVETITGGKTFSANTSFSAQVQTNTFRALSGNVVFARSNNAVIGIFSNSVPNWGFGSSTVPTAIIHETLASTGVAGTAPLKLTSGTNLTTPEAGAIEYDGSRLYLTTTTGPTRNTIAYVSDLTNSLAVLSITATVNTKNTGTTALYTVPAGKTAIITSAYIRCTAATAITVGPSVDIGVTAGDIYPNTALTTLNATNKTFGFFSTGISTSPTATQVINFNVNTAATGTSQTVEVVLLGILR